MEMFRRPNEEKSPRIRKRDPAWSSDLEAIFTGRIDETA